MLVETFFLPTVTQTVSPSATHRLPLCNPPRLFLLLVFRFPSRRNYRLRLCRAPLLPSKTPTSSRASRITRGWKEKGREIVGGYFNFVDVLSIQKLRDRAVISRSVAFFPPARLADPLLVLLVCPRSLEIASRIIEALQARRAHASIARCNFRVTCQLYYRSVSFPHVRLVSLVSSIVATSELREPVPNFRVSERADLYASLSLT